MKPAPFRYLAPATLEEALAAKAQHGDDARFLAGGQSLLPAMNFRLAQPAVLIDLNGVPALDDLAETHGALSIGAMTRHRTLERDACVARRQPLIAEAMANVAHVQIRNRGTLGGNLANADPASEMPAVMLALDARIRTASVRGERTLGARDFFTGTMSTALAPDELLAGVSIAALPTHTGCAFLEIARRAGDFAIAGVACVITLDDAGRASRVRIALCNAADRPILAHAAMDALTGQPVTEGTIAAAVAALRSEIDPRGNVHATPAYQRHLAGALSARAIRLAAGRAGGLA